MAKLTVPVISIVIGEGSSGGALAICVANRIIMLENAVFSILSPEGYASILWKDASRAQEAAEKMKLTAKDLKDFQIIDTIISENDLSFEQIAENMKEQVLYELENLKKLTAEELVENRYQKFRNIGEYQEFVMKGEE